MDPAVLARLEPCERAGIPILEMKLPGPFRAFFTTRVGGESRGLYSSFNLDLRSEDDPQAVTNNRRRLLDLVRGSALSEGVQSNSAVDELSGGAINSQYRLISPMQVHGLRVVGTAEYASRLAEDERLGLPPAPCDGLTLHPGLDRGLAALLLFADCVPLVMVGEVDMAVVHGGWRGILGGVVQQAASAMTGPPGLAFIGPSIGPCSFTVTTDGARAFADRFGPEVVVGSPEAPRVDLWAAAAIALASLGVGPHRVVNPRLCTRCNRDLFFSYRGDGPVTGRQGCVAWAVGG
jgi:copper oxidase (laccase) domain-containing protein